MRIASWFERPWPPHFSHVASGLTVVRSLTNPANGWRSKRLRKLARIAELVGCAPVSELQVMAIPSRTVAGRLSPDARVIKEGCEHWFSLRWRTSAVLLPLSGSRHCD